MWVASISLQGLNLSGVLTKEIYYQTDKERQTHTHTHTHTAETALFSNKGLGRAKYLAINKETRKRPPQSNFENGDCIIL